MEWLQVVRKVETEQIIFIPVPRPILARTHAWIPKVGVQICGQDLKPSAANGQ